MEQSSRRPSTLVYADDHAQKIREDLGHTEPSSHEDERWLSKQSKDTVAFSIGDKTIEYVPNSLFCLGQNNRLRQMLIRMINSKKFEAVILMLIVLNSINMIVNISDPEFAASTTALIIDMVFTISFTLELMVKVMAMGFILGPNTYMKSSWNVLDFVIVTTGMFGDSAAFLRCLRLMRPLRTLNKFPGMRSIVETLVKAIPAVRDLAILALFVGGIFGIVGMNIFSADIWSRCRVTEKPIAPGVWEPVGGDETGEQLCGGGYECEEGYCGNLWTEANATTEQAWNEVIHVEGARYGLLGFQSFGTSLLTLVVVWTMEAWEDIAFRYMDSIGGPVPTIFFILNILIGNIFIVNLIMAILWEQFENAGGDKGDNQAVQLENSQARWLHIGMEVGDLADQLLRRVIKKWRAVIDDEMRNWIHDNFMKFEEAIAFCEFCELEEKRYATEQQMKLTLRRSESMFVNVRTNCNAQLRNVVNSKAFGGIILLFIVANSICLGMDQHPPPSQDTIDFLILLNYIFTAVFTLEALLKVLAYGLREYVRDAWSLFDGIVVITSLLEMAFSSGGGGALSALRTFRLFRVFKLASGMPSLRILLQVLGTAITMCGSFLCVAGIFLFILTVLGMQLFARKLGSPPPQRHFDDVLHAFTSVFILVSGEDWIGFMLSTFKALADEIAKETGDFHEAWEAAMPTTLAYFIFSLFFCNLILLQLFMAILGSSFGSAREAKVEEYHSKLLDMRWTVRNFHKLRMDYTEKRLAKLALVEKWKFSPNDSMPLDTNISIVLEPARSCLLRVVNHKVFDNTILFLIMFSSCTLAIDTAYVDPEGDLRMALTLLDLVFTYVFLCEMLIKMFVFGLWKGPQSYFKNSWNVLDFIVVAISLINLFFSGGGLSAFRVFRALRALRPLRLIKRNKGMKILVGALINSIPPSLQVMGISFMIFAVLAVMSVNYFKGKFWSCFLDGEVHEAIHSGGECIAAGGLWKKDSVNFDNVFSAMFAMFQMSMGAWTDLMLKAETITDASSILFFISCVIVGQFVILNLFIGIIVDEMAEAKKESESAFETKEEASWRQIQGKVLAEVPVKRRCVVKEGTSPVTKLLEKSHRMALVVSESKQFEIVIGACISINALSMCIRHATMSQDIEQMMQTANFWFAMIFTGELLIKLYALRWIYFDTGSNAVDCFIVIGTNAFLVLNVVAEGATGDMGSIMPVMRCFRLARLLRLAKGAEGLAMLFKTMGAVIPGLANVSCLVFLIFFIYSILSMSLFGKIMPGETLSGRVHFHDFGTSMFVWTIVSTGNLWDSLIWDVAEQRVGCVKSQTYEELMRDGPMECGTAAAIPIFVSFLFIGTLIALNLFVGVVLEIFGQQKETQMAQEDAQLEQFFNWWSEYNPDGSRLIPIYKFCKIMSDIEEPVGVRGAHWNDQMTFEQKYRKILREMTIASQPEGIHVYKKGDRVCIHLQDCMLFIARRICAKRTRPSAFKYRSARTTNEVTIASGIEQRFNLRFPELNADGSIWLKNGTRLTVEWQLSQAFAVAVIGKWLWMCRVNRVLSDQRQLVKQRFGEIEKSGGITKYTAALGEQSSRKGSKEKKARGSHIMSSHDLTGFTPVANCSLPPPPAALESPVPAAAPLRAAKSSFGEDFQSDWGSIPGSSAKATLHDDIWYLTPEIGWAAKEEHVSESSVTRSTEDSNRQRVQETLPPCSQVLVSQGNFAASNPNGAVSIDLAASNLNGTVSRDASQQSAYLALSNANAVDYLRADMRMEIANAVRVAMREQISTMQNNLALAAVGLPNPPGPRIIDFEEPELQLLRSPRNELVPYQDSPATVPPQRMSAGVLEYEL